MNYSNKKIISLLLSGAITLGVSAPTVSAAENSRRRYNPSYLSDVAYDQTYTVWLVCIQKCLTNYQYMFT